MYSSAIHTFHIPVMGLAYTIDTPIKVARYGINSVVSIIEDKLVEMMRQHYYKVYGCPYKAIAPTEEDYRAKRITDYLNLMNAIVKGQPHGHNEETREKLNEDAQRISIELFSRDPIEERDGKKPNKKNDA